jgi:hypothetical protein
MPSSQEQSFSASYDSTAKTLSTVVCAILAVVAIVTRSFVGAGLAGASVALCYAYSPRGYAIREGSIFVKRLIGNVCIPFDGVVAIRKAAADDFAGCIRLFGSGGLFGYYGLFRTSKLGTSRWYVTNRSQAVVVVTRSRPVVLSPDDVTGFLAASRPAGAPALRPGVSLAPTSSSGFRSLPKAVAAVVAISGLALGAFCILYSPGAPRYSLTADSLTIHDLFYPVTVKAEAVDIERVRIVDLGASGEWQPTERTNGFANSHYRSGWFRVANGQKVRLYRADGRRLVLLPAKGQGAAVLLDTQDPEQFVREVRQAWLRPS